MARIRLLSTLVLVLIAAAPAAPAARVDVASGESYFVRTWMYPNGSGGDIVQAWAISRRSTSAHPPATAVGTTETVEGCAFIQRRPAGGYEYGCGQMTLAVDPLLGSARLTGTVRSDGGSTLNVSLTWTGYDRPELIQGASTCDRSQGPACGHGYMVLVRQATVAGRIWSSTAALPSSSGAGIIERSAGADFFVPNP